MIVERDRPDRAALEPAQSVLTAGHFAPAECDGVGQRRQRQGQQREVHAAPAQDENADGGRQDGDEDHRQQKGQPNLAPEPVQLDEACGIGADAEPGAVAERHQAGVAHAHVQTHCRDRKDDDHSGGVHAQTEHVHDERQGDERNRGEQQRLVLRMGLGDFHSNFSMRSPSSPRGRNNSTRNIST